MKRKIFLSLIITILCIGCTVIIANASETEADTPKIYLSGDVDLNGMVEVTDYLRIKSVFLGTFDLKGTGFAMADVDFNGEISTEDYLLLKKALIEKTDLDDSGWVDEETKASITYKNFEIYEDDLVCECIAGSYQLFRMDYGVIFYLEYEDIGSSRETDFVNWYETEPTETVTVVYENGVNYVLDYVNTQITNDGCALNKYEKTVNSIGESFNLTYYTDYNGDYCGEEDDKYLSESHLNSREKEVLSQNEIIDVAKAFVKENFVGKSYKFEELSSYKKISGTACAYNVKLRRYVNNIKTKEYVNVHINWFGEVCGHIEYRYHIDEYDLRSFNVNTNTEYYKAKILSALEKKVVSGAYIFDEYVSNGEIIPDSLIFEIGDPEFFISPYGVYVGKIDVAIKEKANGYDVYHSTLGFYAEEIAK